MSDADLFRCPTCGGELTTGRRSNVVPLRQRGLPVMCADPECGFEGSVETTSAREHCLDWR